ncbi:MAG: DNA repair protein RadC [Firmicutes bacterium]|nr:DNA repair protein RadC [Bacillota bacterium]
MKQKKQDLTIKDLPLSERPYEILEKRGAEVLTDAQLLAIILKNGSAGESSVTLSTRILGELNKYDQDPLIALTQMPLASLREFRGIGRVKAIEIQAVMEIAKRISGRMIADRKGLTTQDIVGIYMDTMRFSQREGAWACYFNIKNAMIAEQFLGYGSLHTVLVDFTQVFKKGLECGAYKFVLLHNHPSGDPRPSRADCDLTYRLEEAGQIMNIPLADHIIIGDKTYYSFVEDGKILQEDTEGETGTCDRSGDSEYTGLL